MPRSETDPYRDTNGPGGESAPSRWLFAALVGLSLARFAGLGEWSLWVDEAHTLHDALALARGEWTAFPLGLLATLGAIDLRGGATDEATLRLAPAFFGALGPWLALWAFRPALGARRSALTALLIGVSCWHLYWSQTARAYTLAQDLALVGGGLAIRGSFKSSPLAFSVGLLCTASAAFAHPSALIVALAVFAAPWLALLAKRPPPWMPSARWTIALVLALALALGGWAATVWSDYSERKGGASPLHFLATSGFFVTPPLALVALWSAWLGWKRGRAFDVLAASVCAAVAVLALAASLRVTVSAQYVFVALPWVCALASGALAERSVHAVARGGATAVLVLYGLADQALYFSVRHGDRPRWREAYAAVGAARAGEDLVLGMAAPAGEYYLAPESTDLRAPRSLVRLNPYNARVPAQWARRGRRTWFVVNAEDLEAWDASSRREIERVLAEECRPYARFRVPLTPRDLDVTVYVRD